MILDCHVHWPSPGLGLSWEWAPCTPGVPAAVEYLRRCGIDAVVTNSVRGQLAESNQEIAAGNDEIAQAAQEYPGFVIPACLVNTRLGSQSLAEIRRCHDELGIVWMGELCGYVGNFSYTEPVFAQAITLATDLGMVVQIHDDYAEDMARLCRTFPDTCFVLAHLGDSPEEVTERINLTAEFPNLYLDICGHGYQRMGILEMAVRVAGADRVLFGSDYTINDPAGVIARIQLANFDEDTRQKLLGGNTLRLLREHGYQLPVGE